MSGLTLRLKAGAGERLDLTGVTPDKLAALSSSEIANLAVGSDKEQVVLGDAFDISGTPGDTLTIEGAGATLDFVGGGMTGGKLRVTGNVGDYAGRKMSGGRLEISGNAGAYLGSGMSGGIVHVAGNAGDSAGAVLPGERFGMAGGTLVVSGNIGARAGDKMRRGTIIVKGVTGAQTGTRMSGGTIWAEGGLGVDPGFMMRRGTLIAPKVERLLPTFVDCGRHDLVITRVISRHLKAELGDLAPAALPHFVRKIGGDMSVIGRGEILMPA
ncbi:MAG TPA: formylmethanofuran dehydrogenase subunit C [Hyphomicrobium sp.]|nr:formylmethanofuran dehydrogenase subunit C [Hyphomicrobium sp.]